MDEVVPIFKSIYTNENNEYQNIELKGLMTIGKLDGDPKEDFEVKYLHQDSTKLIKFLFIALEFD